MKRKIYTLTIFLLLFLVSTYAQKIDTVAIVDYVKKYKEIAISEMNRTGIPASITLAQGVHESGFGKSYLAQNTNNHFGIKCKQDWTGKTFKYTDDAPNECFRVYDNVEDSYKDHSDFLKNRERYASLFQLEKNDYKGWSYGLKKAGYATNPKYPAILIKLIEDFELYKFDNNETPTYLQATSNEVKIEKEEKPHHHQKPIKEKEEETTPTKKTETFIINENKTNASVTKLSNKKITQINKCDAIKIYPSKGETLDLVATTFKKEKTNLLAYNDINNATTLKDGDIIFLEKKKKSNKEKTYKVKQEDNMWSISQKKGIQLASLLKINKLVANEEPATKQVISLKKKIKEKPTLRTIATSTEIQKPDEIKPVEKQKMKNEAAETSHNENIVRARDTIYPPLEKTTDKIFSTDSNTVLGWENSTNLLEKNNAKVYTEKIDTVTKITLPNTPARSTSVFERGNETTPTVYPKTIDYSTLPKTEGNLHTVIKGDTLYNISKRYNISLEQLKEWNNLNDANIKLGQVLKIQP